MVGKRVELSFRYKSVLTLASYAIHTGISVWFEQIHIDGQNVFQTLSAHRYSGNGWSTNYAAHIPRKNQLAYFTSR